LFYADDGKVASTDPEWLQRAFDVLVGLFGRIGLKTNVRKTVAMICMPHCIAGRQSDEAYRHRMTGAGHSHRERKRLKVTCPECNAELAGSSLRAHMESQHGATHRASTPTVPDASPDAYRVSFPRQTKSIECPIEGCHGRAATRQALRVHFQHRHPHDTVVILEEGTFPYPKCELCDLQIPWETFNGTSHRHTAMCAEGADRKKRRIAAEAARRASETQFYAYGQPLSSVDLFKYLGRQTSKIDVDWPAVVTNLKKARKTWGRMSRILGREGADAKISGTFYVAVVKQVLLTGSETWVVTPRILKALEGFHHRAARRISRKMPRRRPDGSWHYPPLAGALRDAGLAPISEYVARRQGTIAQYIALRPIFDVVTREEKQRGTSAPMCWWEQPIDFEAAAEAARMAATATTNDED